MSFKVGQIYQDSGGTYYKLEFPQEMLEVFDMMVMAKLDTLPVGLVPVNVVHENIKTNLCYVITSLLSYKDFIKRFEISLSEQFDIIKHLFELYERLDDYMLNPSHLELEREHVFYDSKRKRFVFLYCPLIQPLDCFDCEKKLIHFIKEFCLNDCIIKVDHQGSYGIGFELMNVLKNDFCTLEQIKEIVWRENGSHNVDDANQINQSEDMSYTQSPFYMRMQTQEPIESQTQTQFDSPIQAAAVKKTFENNKRYKSIAVFLAGFIIGMLLLFVVKKIDVINAGVICTISIMASYVFSKKWHSEDESALKEEAEEWNQMDDHLKSDAAVELEKSTMLFPNGQETVLEKMQKHAFHVQPAYETQLMPIAALRYKLIPITNDYPTIIISTKTTLVGRAETLADYVLDATTIGRLHAELNFENGELTLRDFNTLNGTYVNETRIAANEYRTLFENDYIRFADIGYTVQEI